MRQADDFCRVLGPGQDVHRGTNPMVCELEAPVVILVVRSVDCLPVVVRDLVVDEFEGPSLVSYA